MGNEKFVYVTYIRSTPDKIWAALTEGPVTRQYWGHENVPAGGWKPGSTWEHRRTDDARTVDITGKVVEFNPPAKLVLTWARPADVATAAKHSRVTFEIETVADMVRLTVTHDELQGQGDMLTSISAGWPRVLSSLKTFLETGRALDTWAKHKS